MSLYIHITRKYFFLYICHHQSIILISHEIYRKHEKFLQPYWQTLPSPNSITYFSQIESVPINSALLTFYIAFRLHRCITNSSKMYTHEIVAPSSWFEESEKSNPYRKICRPQCWLLLYRFWFYLFSNDNKENLENSISLDKLSKMKKKNVLSDFLDRNKLGDRYASIKFPIKKSKI